jgi:hypothetical protein
MFHIRNIFQGLSLTDPDINHYITIKKLLYSIFNDGNWNYFPIKLSTQCIKYLQRHFRWNIGELLNLPNLSGCLGPGVHPASKRNEYQKQKNNNVFWEVKCGWCIGLITLPPSMSRFCRQCGLLSISQLYRPPRPVTGIALLFYISK